MYRFTVFSTYWIRDKRLINLLKDAQVVSDKEDILA